MTIQNLLDFIIEHRKNKVFKNLSPAEIVDVIQQAMARKCLLVDVTNEKITGVLIWEEAPEYKRLHINYVLSITPKAFKAFLKHYFKHYSTWDIQAERHGDLQLYSNTTKLCNRLLWATKQ